MTLLLGLDTGGTYTDAVVLDEAQGRVIASAKALTSRPDLSIGIAGAVDRALVEAGCRAQDLALVSLSTTLATNALVEGQGSPTALILIGFDDGDMARIGADAVQGSPVIRIPGGHDHEGRERAALDMQALRAAMAALPPEIAAVAVSATFATRNPGHEIAARALVRDMTGLPVTCGHELASGLNGPRRAVTALLNARLVPMIDRLLQAVETHLARLGSQAPVMVVRGDGALVSAALVRERPIETILSGPAASVAGARWLTGLQDAMIADIGGTTTDVCLLRDARPAIDPEGARVGGWQTMVQAVAMQATGLGGDSEVHLLGGLGGGLRLGPRRLMPLSLAAMSWPELVHATLETALSAPAADPVRLAIPLFSDLPPGLQGRDAALAQGLRDGPCPVHRLLATRRDGVALDRLVARGLVMLAGVTPSDAAHVLGLATMWDREAAVGALQLMARQRDGAGRMRAATAEAMARDILDQLTRQSADFVLACAFEAAGWPGSGAQRAALDLAQAGMTRAPGLVAVDLRLSLPLVALGASARQYYGAVAQRLGCPLVVPDHAEVANAVGAVVGQVDLALEGLVSCPGPGVFLAHLATGPVACRDADMALDRLRADLQAALLAQADRAGLDAPRITEDLTRSEAMIEGQSVLIEARLTLRAHGRPRLGTPLAPALSDV
jgi:N-methylhydantoinase A/oxoprolinase/acetone carboxylase beta subunit